MNEKNRQPQEQTAQEKGGDTHPPISVVDTAASHKESAEGTKHSDNSAALQHVSRLSRIKEWAWKITIAEVGMFLLTLVIAISTTCYTKYARRQWRVMQDSNKINSASLVSVQRAFVVFSPNLNTLRTEVDDKTKKPTKWHLQAVMQNTGNTPTRGMLQHTNWLFIPYKLPENFTFPDLGTNGTACANQSQLGCLSIPMVLGPKAAIGGSEMILPKEIADQIGTTMHVYFYGWTTYRDIFDNTPLHKTLFCTELTSYEPATNQLLGATCERHNCSDEECGN